MRLLPDKEKYYADLKNLVEKINGETKGLKPNCVAEAIMDDSREEKSQVLQFVFAVKNTESKNEKRYSVGMYLVENKKGITTFIINGRTMKLLFENSTINSPEIALHYLNDILLNEVKWVAKLEGKLSNRKKSNKKNFQKKPGNNRSYKGDQNKRNVEQPNTKRNYNSGNGFNKKNFDNKPKKNYNNQGTGKQKTGGYKGSTGEERLGYSAFSSLGKTYPSIKTTKSPYKK